MDFPEFHILAIDAQAHSVIEANGSTGEITREFPYPSSCSPSGLWFNAKTKTAYIPAVDTNDAGALFLVNLTRGSLYQLPMPLLHPAQFCFDPLFETGYLATPAGELAAMDPVTLTMTAWGAAASDAFCAGIAADTEYVYTVWECPNEGILAIFNRTGHCEAECPLPGIPTNISRGPDSRLYIPFTSKAAGTEGLAVLPAGYNSAAPIIIPLHCRSGANDPPAYPCFSTVAPDSKTAYVIHEDCSGISIIDLTRNQVSGFISTGRSLSSLQILPDSRFALAGSHMFADFTLIDLVNQRVLSMTDTDRELLGYFAILPA